MNRAESIVRAYLTAMENRDLPQAETYLAAGFTMTFPGGVSFSTPAELSAWAAGRYRRVAKTYERFDSCAGDGETIVYCFGTLHGDWTDGTPFSGIRFIDRFSLHGDRIISQQVWNDLAETRPR